MIIYFVRHASAGQKKFSGKKDEKRPLDSEGISQCTHMGRILASLDVSVDTVISSPLKRATQTASLVANELGFEGKLAIENALRPDAKYEQFRDMLRKYSKAESVMVVGHNPNFSEFLGKVIADNGSRSFVEMKKGAAAKVESDQKKFVLHWLLTPRVAKASAEANGSQDSGNHDNSRNGAGPSVAGKNTGGKKQPQPVALTTKLRPKTSRK